MSKPSFRKLVKPLNVIKLESEYCWMTIWTTLSLFYRQKSLRYHWILSWIMVINYNNSLYNFITLSSYAWASAGITYMSWMGKWKRNYDGGSKKLNFSICMQYMFVRVLKDCTCSWIKGKALVALQAMSSAFLNSHKK